MINYEYLRPQKAEFLKRREEADFPQIEVGFQIFNNSTILPRRKSEKDELVFGRGGVIDSQGNYVEASGLISRFGGSYQIDEIEKRDETVIYCGLFMKHWGHFLVEVVSRLWYFLEHDDGLSKYVFVVEENTTEEISDNYLRFFQLLGIENRLEIINKPICFKTVIVPELGYSRMRYYSNQYKNIFETVAQNAVAMNPAINKADKIYFSRGHFQKAIGSEIGNDLLEHYFKSNGFSILYPEELTLEEMICYIRNADVCATPSGTLPHNYLFAQDNKKTIVVERMTLINEMQVDVDRIKDLDLTYIDGHWLIYPGVSGGGPFCYGYTKEFSKFTDDCSYQHPNRYFLSEKYKKHILRSFLKVHKAFFVYDWGMEKWATMYSEAIFESHEATVQAFSDYIKGNKPFILKHYFQIPYIKRMLKRLINQKRG